MAKILQFPSGKEMPSKPWRTLADAIEGLERELGLSHAARVTRTKIPIIVAWRGDTTWLAQFDGFNDPRKPDGVPLPLPFTREASVQTVLADLLKRYPDSIVDIS